MDNSFWIKYNPNILIERPTKKYFGQFLYRIVIYCPGGRLINSTGPLDQELQSRKDQAKFLVSHWSRYDRDLDKADLGLLAALRQLRQSKLPNLKLRVEEPRIQIYSDSVTDLENLVSSFDPLWNKYVESVSGPTGADDEAILNSNAIIRKKDNGYRYKVIIRDGHYDSSIKTSVLQYLLNLGDDQASLPLSCFNMLSKPSNYIWNCYFYCNDQKLLHFLDLINPLLVSNCHELVVPPHK